MPEPLILILALAVLALVSTALGLASARREAQRLRAEAGARDGRCEEALSEMRAAVSRAERAEQEATHRAEGLAEARRRHDDLDARLGEAQGERHRLAACEAKLLQSIEGLEASLDDARDERAAIAARLDGATREIADLRVTNEGLRADLKARAEAHEGEVALLKVMRQEMTDRFKALADETLRTHGVSFGEANRQQIAHLLGPIQKDVEAFQRELRDANLGAAKDRERLKAEIDLLTKRSEQVSQEAVALTRALKGEKQRQGAWGEMILERLLEDSGLEAGAHYQIQRTLRDEQGGRWRPDVIVRMPRERALVIDSKVSLVAYEQAVNADDPEARRAAARAHVAALRRHIDELAGRGYGALAEGSVDYVLMFVPIEGALALALAEQGDLTAYALQKGVGIMTPTTLMVALRTVEHIWAVERRESNAQEIARRAGLLYDKVALFAEAMEDVGRHLGQAQGAHETAMARLKTGGGNVLGQVEKLRKLGAKSTKSLPADFEEEPDAPPAIEAAE